MAHNDLSLTTAIINLVAPTGIVVGFAKDLLKWLSRQGVDEGAFAECARLSKGLAYPNSNGSKIQTSVVAADEKLRNLRNVPLGLIYSGALGRLMLKDPDYCYMVSTVATLIRHHDVEYAKAALTSMILDQGGHEIECKPKYHVQRAPVKAVISKIVESAHLNVTNPGHHCELLPPELEALHAHCVDDTTFAGTAMAIQRSDSDMMLSTARFPADVVLWILNHFEGTMIVYLGNEELFSKKLGSSQRTLRVLIQERCADDRSLCERQEWPLRLGESLDSSSSFSKVLLTGNVDPDARACPASRRKLYDTTGLNPTQTTARSHLSRELRNNIEGVAKKMLFWLLNKDVEGIQKSDLAVEPPGFLLRCPDKVVPGSVESSRMPLGELLCTTPGLLHRNTGEEMGSAPIFRRPGWDETMDTPGSDNSDFDFTGQQQQSEDIIQCFPAAQDMMDLAQRRCTCRTCRSDKKLHECKPGCLRYASLVELCTLLCHAIADGLGASDISGDFGPSDAVEAAMAVLGEVMFDELVRWDTWFKVGACAVTGCGWRTTTDVTEEEGGSCWIAVQYGSLVAATPWYDLSFDVGMRNCFTMILYEGTLKGITDELAFLLTEQTTPAEAGDTGPSQSTVFTSDNSTLVEQHVNFRADAIFYRRMTIVTSERSLRVVDAAAKMRRLSQTTRPSCKHLPKEEQVPQHIEASLSFFSLPQIIKSWGANPGDDHLTSIKASQLLDSTNKVSLALSLAYGGAVLRDAGRCCWDCAYKNAIEERVRYIISYIIPRKLRITNTDRS